MATAKLDKPQQSAKTGKTVAKAEVGIWERIRVKRAERLTPLVRKWLGEAVQKASPSLIADTRLRELLEHFKGIPDTDEKLIMAAHEDIDAHISRVVVDYLKRIRIRTFSVYVSSSIEAGKLHCIVTVEAKGRSASRYLELKS